MIHNLLSSRHVSMGEVSDISMVEGQFGLEVVGIQPAEACPRNKNGNEIGTQFQHPSQSVLVYCKPVSSK